MSRKFNVAKLKARRKYRGGQYANGTFLALELTGSKWRDQLAGLRVEHNGDCVAAYAGAEIRFEIYTENECAPEAGEPAGREEANNGKQAEDIAA